MLVWFSECTMLVMSEVREFLQIGSLRRERERERRYYEM